LHPKNIVQPEHIVWCPTRWKYSCHGTCSVLGFSYLSYAF
jgi:hypothetical protein